MPYPNFRRRPLLVIAVSLILLLPLLVAHAFWGPKRADAADVVSSRLTASADTYVSSSSPTSVYGSATSMKVTSSSNRGLVRFDTTGLVPAGYKVSKATLRFYPTKVAASGRYEVHPSSNAWSEAATNWNNQPAWNTTVLTTSATATVNTWMSVSLPVASINTGGTTNFGLRYTTSNTSTYIATRESANKPQLLLELAPVSTNLAALAPSGDTYTAKGTPDTNYGSSQTLMATSTNQRAYLRFGTSGVVPAGQRVKTAVLRVFVTRIAVTSGGLEVHPTTDTWSESALTWNTQPAWNATVTATSGTPVAGRWSSIPLSVSTVNTGGNTTMALRYNVGSSNATFASRESGNRPYLLLEFEPVPVSDPGTDPVVMAAGDIACDPGTSVSVSNCKQMAVSDLLVAQQPAAVLTLGDNQYSDGQLSKFRAQYDPSFGRVKPLIRPASGNHEYTDPAGGAKGFYDYFNGEGQATGPAGDRSKGYYSFDIGGWHFIALNSECGQIGGCGAGSPQQTWLAADLAASSAKCTVAYWHRPRFASSSGGHAGTTSMGRTWNDLVSGGVDLVLNGHNHNVEILKPIGVTPETATAPVLDPGGMRQFIVGSGGVGHYTFTSSLTMASDGSVATLARDDDAFGALKLTLRDGAYAWEMVPTTGTAFRNADAQTTGAFSGTETCR